MERKQTLISRWGNSLLSCKWFWWHHILFLCSAADDGVSGYNTSLPHIRRRRTRSHCPPVLTSSDPNRTWSKQNLCVHRFVSELSASDCFINDNERRDGLTVCPPGDVHRLSQLLYSSKSNRVHSLKCNQSTRVKIIRNSPWKHQTEVKKLLWSCEEEKVTWVKYKDSYCESDVNKTKMFDFKLHWLFSHLLTR